MLPYKRDATVENSRTYKNLQLCIGIGISILLCLRLSATEFLDEEIQGIKDFVKLPSFLVDDTFLEAHSFLGNSLGYFLDLSQPAFELSSYYKNEILNLRDDHFKYINKLIARQQPNLALAKLELAQKDLRELQLIIEKNFQWWQELASLVDETRKLFHQLGLKLQESIASDSFLINKIAKINDKINTIASYSQHTYFLHPLNLAAFAQTAAYFQALTKNKCQLDFIEGCRLKLNIPRQQHERISLEMDLERLYQQLVFLHEHIITVIDHQQFNKDLSLSELDGLELNQQPAPSDFSSYSYIHLLRDSFTKYQRTLQMSDFLDLRAAIAAGSFTDFYKDHPLLKVVKNSVMKLPSIPASSYLAKAYDRKLKLCEDIEWYNLRIAELDKLLNKLRKEFAAMMEEYRASMNPQLLREASRLIDEMQIIARQKSELGYLDYVAKDRQLVLHWDLSKLASFYLNATSRPFPWNFYDIEIDYVQIGDSFWAAGMPFKIHELLPAIIRLDHSVTSFLDTPKAIADAKTGITLGLLQSPYTACSKQEEVTIIITLRNANEIHSLVLTS